MSLARSNKMLTSFCLSTGKRSISRKLRTKALAEIIIGKQRNGPIGSFKLRFFGPLTKFENKAPDNYDDYVH